jgi:putative cardiolipin synthase
MNRRLVWKHCRAALILLLATCTPTLAAAPATNAIVSKAIADHPGQTGSYVLNRGEQALLARAWMVDSARTSIEVQYFIWSTDNIGLLAAEALLRAADRGVHVRVIVDDLLMEAPDDVLLALAKHPRIDIRIYNPVHSVGVPWYRRMLNLAMNFRGANQRMHDKTLIVDGYAAITGGRNMADEYFDYDHAYNFRDRDALIVGAAVADMKRSFERFWASSLAAPVESLYDGLGIMQKNVTVDADAVQAVYGNLRRYAADTSNFAPEVHQAIASIGAEIPAVAAAFVWGRVDVINDLPGKNDGNNGYSGGGRSGTALANLLQSARREVLIQSPYLVLSDQAFALLRDLRQRGVSVRISTNSLASTDNLQAFSGYRNQRSRLLHEGIEVFEYRPAPRIAEAVMQRYAALKKEHPVFALHAKTLVVDRKVVFIGTYNLDPRSQNLNTETGVVVHDVGQAQLVADAITIDMQPGNSWNAATDDPDQFVAASKRTKVRLWQWMPVKPLL